MTKPVFGGNRFLEHFKNRISGNQFMPTNRVFGLDFRFLSPNFRFLRPNFQNSLTTYSKTGFSSPYIRFFYKYRAQILRFLLSENAGFWLTKIRFSDTLKIAENRVFWTGFETGPPSLIQTCLCREQYKLPQLGTERRRPRPSGERVMMSLLITKWGRG